MAGAPPKPWELKSATAQAGSSSTPLGPSSNGPKPWDRPSSTTTIITPETSTSGSQSVTNQSFEEEQAGMRVQPGNTVAQSSAYLSQNQIGYRGLGSTYGGPYNSYGLGRGYGGSYNSSYSSPYSGYGGYGGYGGYTRGYGSGYGYGSPYSQQYGGFGNAYGGYGNGYGGYMNQGPDANMGPNGPLITGQGQLPAWQTFINGLHRVVTCFGRVSFLVDENAQAIHFFVTSLLQMLDRAGSLYGEIARLVLRLLGYKPPETQKPPGLEGSQNEGALAMNVAIPRRKVNGTNPSFNSAWKDLS